MARRVLIVDDASARFARYPVPDLIRGEIEGSMLSTDLPITDWSTAHARVSSTTEIPGRKLRPRLGASRLPVLRGREGDRPRHLRQDWKGPRLEPSALGIARHAQ
jgi:hypothetical protein